MARMIPPVIGNETPSPGEKDLFRRFKADPATADWVIFHSFDLPNHRRQVSGEIDFVVVVPELGVLCLEVKAHHHVSRDSDGMWHLGKDLPNRRGPFRQASEGMHSLRQGIDNRVPSLHSIVFWSGVCFTNVNFEVQSPSEWHPWQVIDQKALRGNSIAALVRGMLTKARQHLASLPTTQWFHPDSGEPTGAQIEQLIHLLRPAFEFYESPKSRRRLRNEELIKYTKEQFLALDAMDPSMNPRVMFEGPAGTGKTLLALEEARRSTLRGERVLLCCYNRLLGGWLKREAADLGELVTTTTFHSLARELAGISVPAAPGSEFWQSELPLRALDAILESETRLGSIDTLIVDEAQDLLQAHYLDVLDALLAGGLSSGVWRFFGDFEKQSIYGTSNLSDSEFVNSLSSGVPRFLLTRNCRNTPRIAAFVTLLADFTNGYREVLRPDTGYEPEMIYYDSADDQQIRLLELLDQLLASGYSGRDIAILSARSKGSAADQIRSAPWVDRLRPAGGETPGGTRYCSIHAYKGLEAPIVIVTDVTSIGTFEDQSIFYVAITRAVDRLYVLASSAVKPSVLSLLLQSTAS